MELLFVHGALVRDGAWWWRRAATLLEQRTGIRSRSLALPSCGESDGDPEEPSGLVADAAALRNALLPDGSLRVSGYDVTSFAERFLQDADGEDRAGAWDRVTSQSAAAFSTPTTAAGWQGVDSTYLVCTADRSTTVALQRSHAARATRSVDVPTGHHPFLTRPDLVVAEVEALLPRD